MSEFIPNSAVDGNQVERGAVAGVKSSTNSAVVPAHEYTALPSGSTDAYNTLECSPSNLGEYQCAPWTGKKVVNYNSCQEQLCPATAETIAENTEAYEVTLWDDLQKCNTKYQFVNCGGDPQSGEPITSWDVAQTSGVSAPGSDADQTI